MAETVPTTIPAQPVCACHDHGGCRCVQLSVPDPDSDGGSPAVYCGECGGTDAHCACGCDCDPVVCDCCGELDGQCSPGCAYQAEPESRETPAPGVTPALTGEKADHDIVW